MAYGFNNSKSKVEVQEKKTDITAQTTYLGSATKIPMIQYDSQGHITKATSVEVYPPTDVGKAGQIWESDGLGPGSWVSKDTTPISGSSNAVTSGGVYTALAGKAASSHTHDDRYYTESEINTKLSTKADVTALSSKQDKITISTSDPSGGSNGDIWLKYE